MRYTGHVPCLGEVRNVNRTLVRKSEKRRSLRRPSHKWENNITIALKEKRQRVSGLNSCD
jgi:hypothetical protein